MQLEINTELQVLIPPLSSDEYSRLEKSIVAEGCRDAIVVWNGIIVDGHNRYAICNRHGIIFRTVEAAFITIQDAMVWMIDNQLSRRNLPDFCKCELVSKKKEILLAVGVEEMKKGGKEGRDIQLTGGLSTIDRPPKETHSTREVIAKDLDWSTGKVAMAEVVMKKADEGTKEKLRKAEISINQAYVEIKKAEKVQQKAAEVEEIRQKPAASTNGIYDVIVIDPPWPMQKIERDCAPNQVKSLDYPTMSEVELQDFELPMADDCHVWLWTTHKFMPMAFRLLEHWELKYVCCFTWHKNGGFQPFGLPQYNSEFALYARKGTPVFVDVKAFNTCFQAPRGKHSEKPEEFYDIIRRVTGGSRIDIFSRRKIDGFDQYGNEI